MKFSNLIRLHWAALRALLVLTVIVGIGYPLFIWLVAQIPGLKDKADGSIIDVGGKPVASSLIGQLFTDDKGNVAAAVLPEPAVGRRRRLRPAGHQRVEPGPGEHRRHPRRPVTARGRQRLQGQPADPGVLAQQGRRRPRGCRRQAPVLHRRRCGRGAVGHRSPRRTRQRRPPDQGGQRQRTVQHDHSSRSWTPTKVCGWSAPSSARTTRSVRSCRSRARRRDPAVPADAVTASGSGLDPNISPAYADLQIARVAKARGVSAEQIRQVVADHTDGRTLGILRRAAGQRRRAQHCAGREVPDEELIERWKISVWIPSNRHA